MSLIDQTIGKNIYPLIMELTRFLPHAHAQGGKVIGRVVVVVVVVVSTKIAISRDVGV